MFKKAVHIILSFLLLTVTIGMTVSKHLCGEQLVSVSIFESTDDSSCCNMDDCCQNETHIYQIKEDFTLAPTATVPVANEFEIQGFDLFAGIGLIIPETETDAPVIKASPPVLPAQTALALNQVFRL